MPCLPGLPSLFKKALYIYFLFTFLKHMANMAKRFPAREFIEILLAMCSGKSWQHWQVFHQK
jgi:hypothetical protein